MLVPCGANKPVKTKQTIFQSHDGRQCQRQPDRMVCCHHRAPRRASVRFLHMVACVGQCPSGKWHENCRNSSDQIL